MEFDALCPTSRGLYTLLIIMDVHNSLIIQLYLHNNFFISVPTVSFSEETYSVLENVPKLNVTVVRSGDINSSITVQVANRPFEGTATGEFSPQYYVPL